MCKFKTTKCKLVNKILWSVNLVWGVFWLHPSPHGHSLLQVTYGNEQLDRMNPLVWQVTEKYGNGQMDEPKDPLEELMGGFN